MARDGLWKAQVTLASTTGFASDNVQNVLHGTCDFSTGVSALVKTHIIAFYNDVPTGDTVAVGEWMSDTLDRSSNACRVDIYLTDDFTGATPFGSPVDGANWTLTAENNQSPLPEEVATVISYHGDLDAPVSAPNPTPPPATIRPQSRRRGRMYIGPLNVTCGTVTSDFYRPNSAWRTRLGRAFTDLANDISAIDTDTCLGVWSKADAAVYEVEGGYVDDAWDTQRRRGVEATTRTSFSV